MRDRIEFDHHLDLNTGYSATDWPSEFVSHTMTSELPRLRDVAPEVAVPDLPDAEVLAWLIGRPTREGLPELPAWPF
ncbi:hypothetical protein [Aldersonia kunmingensis]|uniref:hypothetical protein n=1 Tax=Aldersonia kunmingensis TaxID=408066 RepID=UPI0008349564|nr:hypothetical protein [Aldersonia kunmingensis]